MTTAQELISIKTKLEQIPFSFKELVQEELKKEVNKLNPSLLLDPDKIYINIARDGAIFSETLIEALLKKSINEQNFLSNSSAKLCFNPENINIENQITGLNITDVKNSIDRLNPLLINIYRQQLDNLKELPIPQELIDPIDKLLKALMESSSLIERVYQLDITYPNLKQTLTAYFSSKLKNLYNKDIDPSTVHVLVSNEESTSSTSLDLDLVHFFLNYSWFFDGWSDVTLQIPNIAQSLKLDDFIKREDNLTIKFQHLLKLELFWEKNFTNYQILAKFSYLRTLLEQQDGDGKLSKQGFILALRAIGLNQEQIDTLSELDPKEIPLDILEISSSPNQVEVSCLFINHQAASDIIKIRDVQTEAIVIYIPDYTPSFIEAVDEHVLVFSLLFQLKSPDKLTAIASHFAHSIRTANDSKIDAFIYRDSTKGIEDFFSSDNKNIAKTLAQEDIFSFITERQRTRTFDDLLTFNTQHPNYNDHQPNYQSTDSALFATIAAAIAYIPYLIPNIHATSRDLKQLFPSPFVTASDFMKKAIKDKLDLDVNPDQTFISFSLHAVEITISDPRIPPAFMGQKASTTIQSLTEAALSNYREETSPYGYTTIIYQDPSGKREYRSSDQLLSILPKDIEEIVQEADLDALHKSILDIFWKEYTDPVKYFIEQRFLQQILESAFLQKSIKKTFKNPPKKVFKTPSKKNLRMISEMVFHSLSLEEKSNSIDSHVYLEIVCVAGYPSTDIFLFRSKNQSQVILHIAGYSIAFSVFKDYEDCICSLEEQARGDSEFREWLSIHFSMDVQNSVSDALKLGPHIDGFSLATTSRLRPADCSFANSFIHHPITTQPIEKGLFEVIQKNIQERSYRDADAIITSDRELMLQRIIKIAHFIEISLFLPSFGFPILNWGIFAALAMETAAELYIAKNGDTVKERHQAALEAGMNSIGCIVTAFFTTRSLQFSKMQEQEQEQLRALNSGSGVLSFSTKTPVSEEMFFDSTQSMQAWQISGFDSSYNHLDAKAWFLDEQFLLFTGRNSKAKHLIISSHGGYLPGSGIIKVPKDTELVVLGPHGWQLFDPGTTKIAQGLVLPYGIINRTRALPTQTAIYPSLFSRSINTHIHPRETNPKLLAGTSVPGHIRNYTLSKYQKFGDGGESYLNVAQIVHRSRNPFPDIYGIGFQPVDILTIRNRRGKLLPNLADVFKALKNHEIHYDRITLEFCRAKISLFATTSPLKYASAKKFSL